MKTLAFSPDGSGLVSARQDRLQVWEVATGRRREEIPVPAPTILAVAFRPDGATLAALDSSGGVTVFNAATGAVVARLRLGAGHDTKALAYSPDGRWLAGAGADQKTVCLFDAHTYEPSAEFPGHEGVIRAVAFSPDSRRLASCSSDHTVRLWPIDSGECQVLRGHTDEVFAVAFHPDGRRLARPAAIARSGSGTWRGARRWRGCKGTRLRLVAGLQPRRRDAGVRLRRLHGPPVGHGAVEDALPGAPRGRGPAPRGRTAGGVVVAAEERPGRGRGSHPGRPSAERAARARRPCEPCCEGRDRRKRLRAPRPDAPAADTRARLLNRSPYASRSGRR